MLALVMTSCASQQAAQTLDRPIEGTHNMQPLPIPEARPPAASSFESSTLYSLLVAEIAAQRGMERVTLHNYVQEAEHTRDPGIIRQAAQLAAQLGNNSVLLDMTLLWVEVEPSNPTPYRIATQELIHIGEYEKASALLGRALQLGTLEVVNSLASRAHKMHSEERKHYLKMLDQLLQDSPNDPHLLYAKASLVIYEDDLEQSLQLVQSALNASPDYDRAILLEADLQNRLGHIDTALGHLREQLGERDHKQMRTLYTRLLLEKKQFELAEEQANILVQNYPNDHNLLFYLGVLMFEHRRLDASETYLSELSDITGSNSALSYYHGRIAELRGHQQQALEYFMAVNEPPYLMASYNEISRLLDQPEQQSRLSAILANARQQHPSSSALLYALEAEWLRDHNLDQQAMILLDQALKDHPDNTRLRYGRAMLGETLGNLELLESDLRYLLRMEPNNATVLNALGYSLTDNTDRHQEALQLISKAHELEPEDPAILDSMGWVYYHLGQPQKALDYLERAYASLPDPEIAAHLGTVYWALGQKEQAQEVWNATLAEYPDHPLIKAAQHEAFAAKSSATPSATPPDASKHVQNGH